jgi:hypothetical protein
MPDVFELGLVMAGAISAGAYTAGVVDFLFEALDAYEEAKKSPFWTGPRHTVRIPIMTGASAGGMTSAISALHAFRDLEHIRSGVALSDPRRNRLYSSWVTDISIERLLETSDLEGDRQKGGVLSALCCDVLDEIVDKAFDIDGPLRSRAWIGRDGDPNLRLRLTLTNIRGVPYSFPVFGLDRHKKFGMRNHADFFEFVVGPGAVAQEATALDAAHLGAPEWALLKSAALATGAFPVGLRPRLIKRVNSTWYNGNGRVGYEGGPNEPAFVRVRPDGDFAEAPYEFATVDGGTIDNEPLELARRYLAGEGGHNDQNGAGANRAVVLIAPFPSLAASPPADDDLRLVHLLPLLGSALVQQARFKPDELNKAANDKVFSRFMISPARGNNGSGLALKYPIACGAMGGFSGFLHESFRHHDYLLGRRNAQAFLRWNFALPESNPLFTGVPIDRDRWSVKNADGGQGTQAAADDSLLPPKLFAPNVNGLATERGFPIIPLSGGLLDPVEIRDADRPRPDLVDIDEVSKLIGARAKRVIDTLVDYDLAGYLSSMHVIAAQALRFGAGGFGAHIATEMGVNQVKTALKVVAEAFAP